jgi:hypothetical protein
MRLSSPFSLALLPLLVTAIVRLACPCASADQPLAAAVETLFDGTTFAGWNGDTKHTIQFRTVRVPNHHEVIGYQADIGPAVEGCLYDESRRNVFLVNASQEAVAKALAKAKDGWNEYVVRCDGRRIRLSINGVETVDYTEADATVPLEGAIALQIHGKMVGTIRYRNIRIQEFPHAPTKSPRRKPVG